MQETPVGTGPQASPLEQEAGTFLERNDDYWGPAPAFKYLRIVIVPDPAQ
jgi:ABC-type transport system substrate-binding protein